MGEGWGGMGIGNQIARTARGSGNVPSLGGWQVPRRADREGRGDVAASEGAGRASEAVWRGLGAGRGASLAATTALPGRSRTRTAVGPRRPRRVWPRRAVRATRVAADRADPRRLGGPTDVVEKPRTWGGFGDEGDDAYSVRHRVDCCRYGSQDRRPFRVGHRPLAHCAKLLFPHQPSGDRPWPTPVCRRLPLAPPGTRAGSSDRNHP